MDNRIELLKQCNKGIFVVKKSYLRSKNESGYLRYRILRPILKIRYAVFRKLNPPCPWLSPTSVRFLRKYLTKEMVGCEFGSGISTLFIAPKVKHLISIEHNQDWYFSISNKLKTLGISNVDYRFIERESKNQDKINDELFAQFNFQSRTDYNDYSRSIDNLKDESLDFIIIDGRARPECLFYSLCKLKQNAVIILDNSERNRYKIIFEILKHYPCYTTTNGLTDTTFWFKNDN